MQSRQVPPPGFQQQGFPVHEPAYVAAAGTDEGVGMPMYGILQDMGQLHMGQQYDDGRLTPRGFAAQQAETDRQRAYQRGVGFAGSGVGVLRQPQFAQMGLTPTRDSMLDRHEQELDNMRLRIEELERKLADPGRERKRLPMKDQKAYLAQPKLMGNPCCGLRSVV